MFFVLYSNSSLYLRNTYCRKIITRKLYHYISNLINYLLFKYVFYIILYVYVFALSTGRLPSETEEGANSNSATVVQGAVSDPASFRTREAARARTYGERSAARRARASRKSAAAARRAAGPRPR